MTEKDLDVCRGLFKRWAKGSKFRRILLICPDAPQIELIRQTFPDAEVVVKQQSNWDLNTGSTGDKFDMAYAANTFMCSSNPEAWIDAVLTDCGELWLQDLVRAWRNGDQELSPETGDVMRYTWPSRGEEARVDTAYDIDANPKVKAEEVEFYGDTGAGPGRDCLKFVARIVRKEVDAGATRSGADMRAARKPPRR